MKALFALLLLLQWMAFGLCEVDCTENGTNVGCGGACPETCMVKTVLCTLECGAPCVCNPGYIIDESKPACVLRKDCPPISYKARKINYSVRTFKNFGGG
ncbi:accessory gland protein Acp62F-like [Scaptodrosophila lebanonensis]|uniref:Accessory gland protein Acp62F-like n=1 Tax=Drosophila lebanonensis TaxID=7225 RepID=A0A6J2TLR9_DROLE|nr:accessory gland protein Acp62F-like [Scaptodrosophila lebanonensis]